GCAARDWSPKPTQVWVPVGWGPVTEQFPFGGPDSAAGLEAAEARERQLAAIGTWRDGPHKEVALRIFRDGWTLADAAEEQGEGPDAPAFKRLVTEIIDRLGEGPGED